MNWKVGQGFDIHRLVAGRPLMLGGIEIPFARGLLGHSDGDAVLHAVCDAILGAIGAGDIGTHFPDSDEKYRGAASATFVSEVVRLMRERGFRVGNVDVTVFAEQPRLAPHLAAMRESVAGSLEIDTESVNIKAKTMEGLGAIGRGEAIAAACVVLLIGQEGD